MASLHKWLFVAALFLVGTLVLVRRALVIVDTEEDLWPDPRARQAVHLGVLSRRLQAYARDHGALPENLAALGAPLVQPDEWGVAIWYQRAGPVLQLQSAGPDRTFGTIDDIEVRDGTTYESKRALYLAAQDSARRAP